MLLLYIFPIGGLLVPNKSTILSIISIVSKIYKRSSPSGTYSMARSNADVATWASEVQRTVLFLPKFESEADGAKGVKFRNDDDASLSRHLHHFRYLCSAVRLSLVVGSKSSTQQLISLAGIQTAEGNLHFSPTHQRGRLITYLASSGNLLLLNLKPPSPLTNFQRKTFSLTLLMTSNKSFRDVVDTKNLEVSIETPRCSKDGSSRMKTLNYIKY